MTLALALLLATMGAGLPAPETVWEYDCKDEIVGTPVFFPSVREPEGVLAITKAGRMVLVNANGELVWECELGDPAQASPAVDDLDGDGTPEIVTATIPGEVVALDAVGTVRWRYPLGGKVIDWSSACLPDLDGDGAREVLIGDVSGWMNCLSGDGKLLWRVSADPHQVSPAAFLEGTGGRPDTIIFGTENDHVAAVSATGELIWLAQEESQFGRTNPTVGHIDGDGGYEVVVNTSYNNANSRLVALDTADGRLLWDAKLNLHGYMASTIADLDGDGVNEVLVALRSNTIYCFDGDGTERWHTVTGGHAFFWAPSVADIDGDGRCEVIAGVRDANERGKSWFILDDEGTLLGEYEMPGGANGGALVADLNLDGRVDIVLPASTAGLLRCMTFGGKTEGARMPWTSQRYDAARLGCVPAKPGAQSSPPPPPRAPRPLEAGWSAPVAWGASSIEAAWPACTIPRVVVEAAVVGPFGRRTTRLYDLAPGDLPQTVSVDLVGAGAHTATVRLWDPADWNGPRNEWTTTVDLAAFPDHARAMAGTLDVSANEAADMSGAAPNVARMLLERHAQRLGALDALEARCGQLDFGHAPNADAFLEDLESFQATLEEDRALVRLARAVNALRQDQPLAVWEDPNPWDDVALTLEAPTLSLETAIDVALYRGEYESRAVTLLNLHPAPLTVQVRPDEAARQAVRLYEVIRTPRPDGTWVPDALSELNSARTLQLAPGQARQFWLSVSGGDLESGVTEFRIDLLPLGFRDSSVAVLVRAHAYSLDLAEAPVFRVCNWSSPQRIRSAGLGLHPLDEAKRHGMNVFTSGMPARKCDVNGDLVGAADWSAFDTDLDLMEPGGFVLLSGHGVPAPEGVERYGGVHVKAQRAWLTELASHLEAKGWGKERWALYPVDEPGLYGGTRIEAFLEIARHFKAAMPSVPIYANPSGFVTPENMAGMVPLVDVWCPEQALMRRQPELAPFFCATGKPVWCYEAPGDVKTLHPLGYYRANSWMAFQMGLTGTGFWTQFYVGAHYGGNDLWMRNAGAEYGANYVAAGREVISRRWEAFRDGIEDARAFMMLRDAAEKARVLGLHGDAVARADRLLGPEIEKATRKAWACGDITRFLRDYEMDYAEIQRIRQQAAKLTLELRRDAEEH